MDEIISLKNVEEYKLYSPILTLIEDLDFDNQFYVLNTNLGNIAFSYYDLGITPNYVIQNRILFLSFGKSYYIVNLKEKNILYQSKESWSVILDIVKSDLKSCIVFIGEMSLICFSLKGKLMWENNYRNTIVDWSIMDAGASIVFENDEKWLILFENGNGIPDI